MAHSHVPNRSSRRWIRTALAAAAVLPLLATAACSNGGGGAGNTGGDSGDADSSEVYELVFSSFRPAAHPAVVHGIEPFIEEIEERSGGRIQIELYTDEALGTAKEQIELVRNGTADFAETSPAQLPADLPYGDVMGLYVPESEDPIDAGVEQAQAMWTMIHGAPFTDRLAELDLVPFGIYAQSAYEYFSNSPIEKIPEDLTKSPTRSPGGLGEEVMAALGMTPIQVSSPELYEAMSRGTIGSYVFPWTALETYSLGEQTTYATSGIGIIPNPPLYGIMSATTWESLPEDLQQIVYEAGKNYSYNTTVASHEDSERVRDELVPAVIQVREITAQERTELSKVVPQVLAGFVDRMSQSGNGEWAQLAVDALNDAQSATFDPSLPVADWPDFTIGK